MKQRGKNVFCVLSATAFFVLLSLHAKSSLLDHFCGKPFHSALLLYQ